ncbi:unnamed protein product [Moneuplotes crassus]|uniref:Uncharacterized protein n=1 Tax=Euplotes crassus TaxID=5936 RepID=A0AAD1U9U0_EUPCR|nr:unnamed protein product [Moneuplotes crassus]
MESDNICVARDCENKASYYQKELKLHFCANHYELNSKENWVKVESIGDIEVALDVTQSCNKNFQVAVELQKNKGDMQESIHLSQQLQTQMQDISDDIAKFKLNEELSNFETIKAKIKDIYLQLRIDEGFKQFCVVNYTHLMCDYFEADKSKVDYILGIENNEASEMDLDLRAGKKKTKYYRELQKELVELKQRAVSLIDPSTLQGLEKCYKLITKINQDIEARKRFILEFDDEIDIEFVKSFGDNIVPNLENLEIDKIQENLEVAKEFLFSSFPQSVENFHLNFEGKMHNCHEIIDVLCYLNPRIMRSLCIYSFEINQIQMKRIFQIVKQSKTYFGFLNCKLELDTIPDFGNSLDGSIIEILCFDFCGRPEYSDWKNHPERFTNLIEGLSRSAHFKQKIKQIELMECGMTKINVQTTLGKYGLEHVEILDHSI